MKILVVYTTTWLLTVFSGMLTAQTRGFDLARELRLKRTDDVIAQAEAVIAQTKGTAQALYLQAVLVDDARQASELYTKLIARFPTSDYAPEAQYRNALYYFSRGLYVSAQSSFDKLIRTYPASPFAVSARYLSAASSCASKQSTACLDSLRSFIETYPGSDFATVARQDLREFGSSGKLPTPRKKPRPEEGKGNFTLQVGAFSRANNALNLRNAFVKAGYPGEITETSIGGQEVFLVLVGRFESRKSAEAYGDKIKREYGKPYRVVSR